MGRLQKLIKRISDKFPFGFGITMFINMIFYAMVSTVLFSFLPKMVKYFGASEVETGYKAGLIATSFYIGQFVFSMAWGYAADTIQLRYALILAGTCLSATTVLFGLSRTFYWAFIARFLQGSSMGHLIIFKILINVVCEERHVAFGLSLMMSAFTVGSIVGPSIGGFLAFPADQYPNIISHENIFGKFGILLPNLVLVFGVVIGILLAIVYLPKNKKVSSKSIPDDVELQECASTKNDAASPISHKSGVDQNGFGEQNQKGDTENPKKHEKDTLEENNTQIDISMQHANEGYSKDENEDCADTTNDDATHSDTGGDPNVQTIVDVIHDDLINNGGVANNDIPIVDGIKDNEIDDSDVQKSDSTMSNDIIQGVLTQKGSSTPIPLRNDITDNNSIKSDAVNITHTEKADNQFINDNSPDIEPINDDNDLEVEDQPINVNNVSVEPINIENEDNQTINGLNLDIETNNDRKNVNFPPTNCENSVTEPINIENEDNQPISGKSIDNQPINDVPNLPTRIEFSQNTNAPTTKTKQSAFATIKNSKLGQVLRTRNALISVFLYMFFSMLDIGYSEILPILTSTSVAYRGMGMTPSQLGTLLLIAPTCYFIPQVIFGPKLIGRYGAKCSFIGLNLVMTFSYAVLPIMSAIEGRTLLNISLIALIIVIRVSAFGCFVAANMLVNNSVPPNLLGTINGFSASATALGRLIAPILFGGMYSWSLTNIVGVHGNKHPLGFPFNQFFTFFVLALSSVFIAVVTTFLPESINDKK